MRVVVILAALHLSAGFMTPLVQPGMLRSSAASRGLLSLACDRRPPVAPARLASSAVPQNMASGDGGGGKGKWGDPPVEIVDDAVDRAVTLIKASGGSMDSLSFGAAWKVAYPTYDKDVFKNTCVTSFTKLLQRYAQDDILVESTAKKEVKIYKLKDAKVREQLEQSIKMTMQTMEFFSEISESGGPWSLTRNVMSVGPGPSISKNDITLSLPPDMVKYTKLSQLIDDMEPTVIAIENKISSLPAKEAVAALHHLRRLSWQAQYQVQRNRLESIMNVFAQVASGKLNNLTTKSIALLLSSLSDRDNFQPVFDKAAERLNQMAEESLALGNVPKSGSADADAATVSNVFSAQAVAVIVNAFAKSKRRDEKLFRSMSRVVLALPPDSFDAQAIAGIANGFASADVRPHDEALFARLTEIANQLEPGSWTPYAVGLAVSAFQKVGVLEGNLLSRLAQLTEAFVKSQGPAAFQDPSLLADMMAAFSEAGEATGAPQKEVIGLLASSFTTLMMPPVKSQDSSSGSKTSAAVAMNPPSEDDEENEETLQGLEDEGKQGLAGSPKRGKAVKSKEQQEKAAQAASLRFRKKLDVVIISKVTTSMCTAGVFGSAQLWTSFSRSLQSSKFQPWQASDWGRTLENFSSAAKAKAVPPNNLGPLFQHVAKEIETGETAALLSTDGLADLSRAFSAEKTTKSNASLYCLLANSAANIPSFKYTPESVEAVMAALKGWMEAGGLGSNDDAKAALEKCQALAK